MINNSFCSIVIVTFNPDNRFLENIKVLSKISFLKNIFVVDNSTKRSDVINTLQSFPKVSVLKNNKNEGIGYAQNIGIYEAKALGYKWVLTLDHDTIVNELLLVKYKNFIDNNDCSKIAVLATDYYDIGSKRLKFNNSTPIDVSLTISSGSLLNIDVYDNIGKLKENYFIDQVDNEYCYRAIKNGFRIVILPGLGMEHRLGKTKEVNLFGKTFFLYNQVPIRTFFRTRNMLYFAREYSDMKLWREKICAIFIDFFKLLLEENSLNKIFQFCRGIYHGVVDKI